MSTCNTKPEIVIKRGWSSAGAYFYARLPNGETLESVYEGALLEMIKTYNDEQRCGKGN